MTVSSAEKFDTYPLDITFTSQDFKTFFDAAATPLHENAHWGNELGDKDNQLIRIYYQNIHGIMPENKWHKWEHSVVDMHNKHIDVCCFSETNIKWTPNAQYRAAQILRDQYKYASLYTASFEDPTLSLQQQGGTCIGVTGKLVGMIGHKGIDSRGLGRWCYIQVNCKNQHKLIIVVAYRVGSNSHTGHNTVYSQQYRSLRRQDIDRPNPQREFDKDLCTQLRQWRLDGCDILLAIDTNAGLDDSRVNNIVSAGNLCDILGSKHGIDSPPTFTNGSKTIDFFFGTTNVQRAVQACGYLPFNDGIRSDHRGLWLDLNLNFFSYGPVPEMTPATSRLSTTNQKWVQRMKEQITNHIKEANIRTRLDALQEKSVTSENRQDLINELESIDGSLHDAMTTDASKGIHLSPTWWSPDSKGLWV